jgi:hypothetical protein
MGSRMSKKEAIEGARDFEKEKSGERDSSKEFSRAGHQAREDAQSSDHPYDKWLTEGWTRTPDSERNKETSDTSTEDKEEKKK